MTIDLLGKNIGEIERLSDIISEQVQEIDNSETLDEDRKKLLNESIDHSLSQIKMLNEAIPEVLKDMNFYKTLPKNEEAKLPASSSIEKLSYRDNNDGREVNLALKKKDRMNFLERLIKHRSAINKLEDANKKNSEQEKRDQVSAAEEYAGYIKISNKFFRKTANVLASSGYFDSVRLNLIKITSSLIFSSYIAVALFSTMISFFAGLFLAAVLFLFKANAILVIILLLGIPLITFILFITYPSSKRKSLEKDINQELPFLVIYMAAISTSGIEPSKIFNIIVASKDYPFIQREVKKLTNYVNFYGLDLVAALKSVSKNNPSERLGQLFDGLATTITSGGELTEFLGKHSETLLFDYRLEREKYTRTAETFMNIYISVVIAAPMILMMLFILMSLGGLAQGFLTPFNLSLLAVFGITFLNIAFLLFLNTKQPKF